MDNTLAGRDVLRLLDLTAEEIKMVIEKALNQKASWRFGIMDQPFVGKAVAIIMEKDSLRTRVSFELGISRLGATPIVLTGKGSAFSRGESVQDTALVLERYADAIVLRTAEQAKIEEVAEWASVPVINALTDDFHPCQVLADLLTLAEYFDDYTKVSFAYVGDGNNMAHSYLEAASLLGMAAHFAIPDGYGMNPDIVDECLEVAEETGATIRVFDNAPDAVKDVDVVITDTWASMGDEDEHDERVRAFQSFQVNSELMALAKEDALFMHCLPAHRGEEVTNEVIDSEQSVVFDEAENRLHAQKALLSLVMANEE